MQYRYLQNRGSLTEPGGETDSPRALARVPDVRPRSRPPRVPVITDLKTRSIPLYVVQLVPESICRENEVIPVAMDGERITIASHRPDDLMLADKLRFIMGRDVVMAIAPRDEILAAINRYHSQTEMESVDSMLCEFNETARPASGTDYDDDLIEDMPARSSAAFGTKNALRARASHRDQSRTEFKRGAGLEFTPPLGGSGMLFYTVEEGQRVLMRRSDGTMEILVGPRRVWQGRNTFRLMDHYIAHPGEFLIVRNRDGSQFHLPGPADLWFDPRTHESVTREECLQIAAREAVVVYSKEEASGTIARRVVHGPSLFVPQPGEWLHTFQWHASKGGSKGIEKVPRGLVFQKLWLMPDQMYHDVPDVRTADDAVLTIRLMLFFELIDIDVMLNTTHDPIGDFVNAATADVVEFVGRHDFEAFKQNTDQLNEIGTYRQLTGRAAQCGYRINNVVYRGYGAPQSLQQMHDQAIETRTRLQLEQATEKQAQDLEDYRLTSQMSRAAKRRTEQSEEVRHNQELESEKLKAELQRQESEQVSRREQHRLQSQLRQQIQQQEDTARLGYLQSLKDLGVDLTQYLTQSRADQVIELRGQGQPHLHLKEPDAKAQG